MADKPTIKQAIEESGQTIKSAIRKGGMEERENTARDWLRTNRWPKEELLKFAKANGLGDSLQELNRKYAFELARGHDTGVVPLGVSLHAFFERLRQGRLVDYGTDPPVERRLEPGRVVLHVQAAPPFIAARDYQLAREIIAAASRGTSFVYVPVDAENKWEDSAKDLLRVFELAASLTPEQELRPDSENPTELLKKALENIYVVKVPRSTRSVADLFVRCVVVSELVQGSSVSKALQQRPWPDGLQIVNVLIGIDQLLHPDRANRVDWTAFTDVTPAQLELSAWRVQIFPEESRAMPLSGLQHPGDDEASHLPTGRPTERRKK